MTTAIYIFAAVGCMSIGACIGLCVGAMLSIARRTDDGVLP